MKKEAIGIIGAGNMGTAIIAGVRDEYALRVCENDTFRIQLLRKKHKLNVFPLKKVCAESKVIILAVKPQSFKTILKEISEYITPKHLVISIAAGVSTKAIEQSLPKKTRVIRAMPNLPSQVAMGMTVISSGKQAKKADASLARRIFQHIGLVLEVEEKKMDAVTAVSGSGPAYVFLFIEQFLKASKAAGLNEETSKKLVFQTIHGSLGLLEEKGSDAEDLRKKVTSKGGTTAAALDVFKKNKSGQTFIDALKAAKNRSKELAK